MKGEKLTLCYKVEVAIVHLFNSILMLIIFFLVSSILPLAVTLFRVTSLTDEAN